jgi:hypothetical protein
MSAEFAYGNSAAIGGVSLTVLRIIALAIVA